MAEFDADSSTSPTRPWKASTQATYPVLLYLSRVLDRHIRYVRTIILLPDPLVHRASQLVSQAHARTKRITGHAHSKWT